MNSYARLIPLGLLLSAMAIAAVAARGKDISRALGADSGEAMSTATQDTSRPTVAVPRELHLTSIVGGGQGLAATTFPSPVSAGKYRVVADGEQDWLCVALATIDSRHVMSTGIRYCEIKLAEAGPATKAASMPASAKIEVDGPMEEPLQFDQWVVNVGAWRTDPLLVFSDGQWGRLFEGGYNSGPGLPGKSPGRVLAMMGIKDQIWAIGIGDEAPPTTGPTGPATVPGASSRARAKPRAFAPLTTSSLEPATVPSVPAMTATTSPASGDSIEAQGTRVSVDRGSATAIVAAPAPNELSPQIPPRLRLYVFTGAGRWESAPDFPDQFSLPDPQRVSLASLGHDVLVAGVQEDSSVRTLRYDPAARRWSEAGVIQPPQPAARCKLLETPGRPTIWIAGQGSTGQIWTLEQGQASEHGEMIERWIAGKTIELPPGTVWSDCTMTTAGLGLRLIAVKDDGKMLQQMYGLDGTLLKGAAEITIAQGSTEVIAYRWLNALVVLVLMSVLVSSLRRGPSGVRVAADLQLATFGSRFVAGCIDLIPILIPLLIGVAISDSARDTTAIAMIRHHPLLFWADMIGSVVYLAHTMLSELFTGRTLGKWMMGLKVVSVNGQRPTARAIAMRNLMRLVDIFMLAPMLFIMFSPLRQRLGDALAATTVVSTEPPELEAEDGESP